MEPTIYVGTYTGPGKAEGIYAYRFDPQSGAMTHAHTITGVENPSFLALDRTQRYLYAVEETSEYQGEQSGAISAFVVDQPTGNLTFLNRQRTRGTAPCFVSLDHSGRFALVANYGSGSVASFAIQPDGSLREADFVQHQGGSTNPRRQEGPHGHSIQPTPDGAYVIACDLGLDRVLTYTLDEAGRLAPHTTPYAQVSSGAGPRHASFHPNGRLVYVNNEIDSTVSVFAYDAARGAMQIVQTVSSLPDDVYGPDIRNSTAQVLVHPNGRYVYVSNRGHDSIAVFAIDEPHGRVRSLGHQSTLGKTPRNFTIDPTGRWLVAANQSSNTLVSFRISDGTDTLTPSGHTADVPAPVCVIFAAMS